MVGAGPLEAHFARARILQGASRVFATRPVAEVSVEDVLREANVSRRTFYRFFANKDELLGALFEVAVKLFVDAMREAAGRGDTARAKIVSCVDAYIGFARNAGPLLRVLQGEAQRPGSSMAAMRRAALGELADLLDKAYSVRVEPLVLHGVLHALEGITRTVLEDDAPSERDLARARAAMLRIILATLEGEGDGVPPLPRRRR